MDVLSIEQEVLASLRSDKLILPTLPEVALEIREAAQDPNVTIQRLVELISQDTGLTASLVKIANSPLVRGVQHIDDLPTAINRLGIKYSCNLCVGLAMEQMFQATNAVIDQRLHQSWSRSIEVAAIASVLANHYSSLPADEATLAGLTHLIGELPILVYLEEHDQLLAGLNSENLEILLEDLGPKIGEKILKSWKFQEKYSEVPVTCANLEYNSEITTLSDIVIVARVQSMGIENLTGNVTIDNIPAFAKLGLVVNDEEIELGELNTEVNHANQALRH